MNDIGEAGKVFSLNEARAVLPLVVRITDRHRAELEPFQARLNRMLSNDPRRAQVEQLYEQVVERWKGKIERLGATASGLWVVDFDVGDGFLSWRYPELSIAHHKGYDAPFSGRVKLRDYIDTFDPDWAV